MTEILYSPMAGKTVDLDYVNDEVFSRRLLGDGVAIIPEGEEVFSPADGIIKMIYDTKHAIGIEMSSGFEILLHMGIDTVTLDGIPFDTKVKIGDVVKKGDLLTVVDWSYVQKQGCEAIVPVLVINQKVRTLTKKKNVQPGDELLEVDVK